MENQGRGGGGGRPNYQNQRGRRRDGGNTGDQNQFHYGSGEQSQFWGSGNVNQRVGPTGGGRGRGGNEYQNQSGGYAGRGRGRGGYGDGNQLNDGGRGRGYGGQNQFGGYGNNDQMYHGGGGRGNGGQNQFGGYGNGDQMYHGGGGRGNGGQNQFGGQRRNPGVGDGGGRGHGYQGQYGGDGGRGQGYQDQYGGNGGRGQGYQGQYGGNGSGNQRNPGGTDSGRGNRDQNQFGGYGHGHGNSGQGRGSTADAGSSSSSGADAGQGSQHAQLVTARDPLNSELQAMRISPAIPKSSITESGKYLPMRRPDKGGTAFTQRPQLFVNHFPVGFNPKQTIFHYDVEIKLKAQPKNGKSFQILKPDMRAITNKFFSDFQGQFLSMTAYDGEKNVFSALELPQGKFNLELSRGEGQKPRTYEFTIKLVKKLELQKLEDYLKGRLQPIPREILQGMDVIMKENPTRHWMSIGKGFYSRDYAKDDDIGGGIIASKGFQHSLKPTSQGLVLCVDYSVLPLRKPIPVMQFIKESLNISLEGERTRTMSAWEWRNIEKALKGLKVRVTHRKTKQQYKIEGLTKEITKKLRFTLEDAEDNSNSREMGLVEYFRTNYGKEIKYQNLPSLDFSKNNKINWVPMEFCELVEGQRYPKENLDRNVAQTLKNECLAEPRKRRQVICDFVNERNGPCGGDIAENFEISVRKEMTQVIGRVIGPPGLRLGDSKGKTRFTPNRDDCQWNLRSVLEGKQMERWAVLDFTSADRDSRNRLNTRAFVDQLMDRLKRLGMRVSLPLLCEASNMNVMSHATGLGDLLKRVTQQAETKCNGKLQILICVMTRKDPGYKNLKRISETEIGIMTQCCLVNHANMGKEIYLGNLGLKINAKLGGSNMELFDRLPHFKGDDHVMFIGADVNHPGSWNVSSPSIAAVVATINWPATNRYVARISPQEHRKEQIQNFGEICLDLVKMYTRLNNIRPQRIVLFRDGVADNQFDMVLNEELRDLKNTICSGGYCPTITLVVCQKRHQTRLFPKNMDPRNKNVLPGTVVDTDVVHPDDFDFYFCSHYGGIGTSKPTHYTVLYDDHGFTSDEMQRLIYNLCYTFARCTKPVSLVPPVYYADLVAYRGRLYYDAVMESSPGSSSSSSTLSPSSSSVSAYSFGSGFDSKFFKLHSELENSMFFC